jgi:Mn2+/Fe2+ NRAMP family transporter
MGRFVNATWMKALAWTVTVIICGLNAYLLVSTIRQWIS